MTMNTRNVFNRPALGAALAFAVLYGTTTLAATTGEATQVVRYREADVGQRSGAQMLYGRIRVAARIVCHEHDGAEPARRQRYTACLKASVDRAVEELDAPLVTALHEQRAPVSLASAAR
jgi:UrcA family protein